MKEGCKTVLLPLDGSDSSLKALIPARSLAKALNLTLKIIFVSSEPLSKAELITELGLTKQDVSKYIIVHLQGDISKAIINEAQNAAYIVMGTHGQTKDMSKIAGRISSEVIQDADIPVLLIKPDVDLVVENGTWKPKKALIPLNGTPGAAQSLLPAIELFAKNNIEVDILHIISFHQEYSREKGALSTPYYADSSHHEWVSWNKEFLRRFCPLMDNTNVKYSLFVIKGNPAEEIFKFAQSHKNDFIAMAWHGDLGEFRAETLKKVIAEAKVPILLIEISA